MAQRVADKDYAGLADVDIRKTAVSAVLGQDAIAGKSDDYISARFDILSEDANQDPVRRVVRGNVQPVGDNVEQAHAAMVDGMTNAWQGTKREGV